jgi:hypothetical protein
MLTGALAGEVCGHRPRSHIFSTAAKRRRRIAASMSDPPKVMASRGSVLPEGAPLLSGISLPRMSLTYVWETAMHKFRVAFASAIGAVVMLSSSLTNAAEERLPTTLGACVLTEISAISSRLVNRTTGQPIRGSGSAVSFDNKGYQVSYAEEPAILRSRRGDKVYMCLMQVPRDCLPGDDRGRIYTTTNLRTMASWTLPDAEHRCGGA